MTINNVVFSNVPNKKQGIKIGTMLTQSNIPMSQNVQEYIQSEKFYKLVSALDIDWSGIEIDANTTINDTADLINWINSISANAVAGPQGEKGDKGDTGTFDPSDLENYASKTYVSEKISEVVGAAPETLDTLKEIADKLGDNDTALGTLNTALSELTGEELLRISKLTDNDTLKVAYSYFKENGIYRACHKVLLKVRV